MHPLTLRCIQSLHISAEARAELTARIEQAITASIRREAEAAMRAERTHCKHDHALTPANTYYARDGRQVCRTCDCLRSRARAAARRAR